MAFYVCLNSSRVYFCFRLFMDSRKSSLTVSCSLKILTVHAQILNAIISIILFFLNADLLLEIYTDEIQHVHDTLSFFHIILFH